MGNGVVWADLINLKVRMRQTEKNKEWCYRNFWYQFAGIASAYDVYQKMNLPKLSLKGFRRDISRGFVSSVFVTSSNKCQTTSRSVQIKNKKPYVTKVKRLESYVPSQKDPRDDDMLLAAQKQSNSNRMDELCLPSSLVSREEKKSSFHNYHAA
ncbi:hypothetical protein TNCV_184481 [Trichonephila clavipes]|nr:hypothetical protein TNCV_184481 [Trichonephila clavipes]